MTQKSSNIKKFPLSIAGDQIKEYLIRDGMVSIDLQLTPGERQILQDFRIETDSISGNFLYWGSVNNPKLLSNFELYLSKLGKNKPEDVSTVNNLIMRIAKSVTRYLDTEFAWIETKTFLANETFVVPRWHTDNKFFVPHTAYKLVWAAMGPQTRFGIAKNPESFKELTKQEINAGHGTEDNIRVRKEIDQIVEEINLPEEVNAVLYRSGGENPMVHSEPYMSEDRLFIAIVPGSKEEIIEWHERKKQKDIRKNVQERKWYYYIL
jgi:hypothetical protein